MNPAQPAQPAADGQALKVAIKAAVSALTKNVTMSVEDQDKLKEKWGNNTKKLPNAPQEVREACMCDPAILCLL